MQKKHLLVCFAALASVFASAFAADSEVPLPRFVGFVGLGADSYAILADNEKDSPARWVKPGDKFRDFDVLLIDKERNSVVLGRGRDTFTVGVEAAKIRAEKGEPGPMTREQGVKLMQEWLSKVEESNLKLPLYQPLDPGLEIRASARDRTRIEEAKARAAKKGLKLFVTENEGTLMFITLDKVASELPTAKTAFRNLTEEDWKSIDERYARAWVERAAAQQRVDLQKHKQKASPATP